MKILVLVVLSFILVANTRAFAFSVRTGSSASRSPPVSRTRTATTATTGAVPPLHATTRDHADATAPPSSLSLLYPIMPKREYTQQQLKLALESLLVDSPNPEFDARHIHGFGVDDHELSMLQTITATVMLDYQAYMDDDASPSPEELLDQANVLASTYGPRLDLRHVIQSQAPRMALAAEFKRASPSKGAIAMHLNASEQAAMYAQAGANIISVLTEQHWFKGNLGDLQDARLATTNTNNNNQNNNNDDRPAILRKEFIVNEYMIAEAAAYGADTVLLIVAVLPQHVLQRLITYCRSIGMEPLVEVHADEELDVALQAGAKVIGINNRNLHTFKLDLSTTDHIASLMDDNKKEYRHGHPDANYVLSSLSGMSTAMDVHRYRGIGVGMCLIGESLMRATDPQKAIQALCLDPTDYMDHASGGGGGGGGAVVGGAYTRGTQLIKVCGITNSEDALLACQSGANLIGVIFVPPSKRCVTVEQAQEVVKTVRAFGERSTDIVLVENPPTDHTEPSLTRIVTTAQRLKHVAGKRPLVVGVFQNQPFEFIRQMVSECGLDMVQLHGQEGMAACDISNTGAPTIRVVDIETDPQTGMASHTAVEDLLRDLTHHPAAILLDTAIKGTNAGGGTGVTFDWSIAQRIQDAGLPVIIAGGLTPDNVKDAVSTIRPWGIDVSSGVEATPGKKDSNKVVAFLKNAKEAAVESSKGF